MTQASRKKLFRQGAEAEGGMAVSAGARVAHVQLAVESGRAFYVDLSGVPEDKRGALVAEIKELVKRVSTLTPQKELDPASDRSGVSE
jgi:hypothetical protein